ncbi:MAG: hypothetical protein RL757_34 [Bacteroidota bacterium]|jgi:hypothetical protein
MREVFFYSFFLNIFEKKATPQYRWEKNFIL